MSDIEETEIAESEGRSELEELDELRADLDALTESNDAYVAEHGLGMSPLATIELRIRVLVGMLCPTDEDKVAFDIEVQTQARHVMEKAVRDELARAAEAKLAAGISTADIAAINAGRLPGGAVDLEQLKGAPRAARRAAARAAAKDLLR